MGDWLKAVVMQQHAVHKLHISTMLTRDETIMPYDTIVRLSLARMILPVGNLASRIQREDVS